MELSPSSHSGSGSEQLGQPVLPGADACQMLAPASSGVAGRSDPPAAQRRRKQVHAAETRLLYENANTGIIITILIAVLLGYAQWNAIPHVPVSLWVAYMLLVSAVRFMDVRRYRRAPPEETDHARQKARFVAGAALAGAGWGAAAIVLYPVGQA